VIDGVKLVPRIRHADDRGYVTEVLRAARHDIRR
jgi:dTDP-4-dehydrorhamnose 3,5-epimerase-like enzyme